MLAADDGNFDLVKFLVDKGASLDAVGGLLSVSHDCCSTMRHCSFSDEYGDTVVHYAIERGHITIVQYLGEHNAQLNVPGTLQFFQIFLELNHGLN